MHKNQILNATLYVHLPRAARMDDAQVWIDTYMMTLNHGDVVPKRMETTKVELDSNYGGWVKLNVTTVVQEWIEHRTRNFGLELKVKTGSSHSIEIPIPPRNPSEARGTKNNVSQLFKL